jgi:hypothetical protein
MDARIVEHKGSRIKIEVEVDLTGSMLEMEEKILDGVNAMGNLASGEALKKFDADGENLTIGGTTWYSKGQQKKTYHTPYGDVTVRRHVYQNAEGGATMCPMDDGARIVIKSTPRYAKMIAHKSANNAVSQVMEDLEQNHGRRCLKATAQDISTYIGSVAQAKEESWDYAVPDLDGRVKTIGIGVDGTCMLLCDREWREAMTGTISLYDKNGERLHTIYVGAAPEYGKQTFFERMTREINRVKNLYPQARYVGIADGASTNWDFLKPFIDEEILDFYHATQYLAGASDAMGANDNARATWLDEACHNLKHKRHAAKNTLKDFHRIMDTTQNMKRETRKKLQSAITYFSNHLHQMNYADYAEAGYPIGSGVTEAACKTLVKQRLCCSGMRWTPAGAQTILSLRALVKTDCRWDQFWQKISQFGVPKIITS